MINEEYFCIYALGDFFFALFIEEVKLTSETFLVIIDLIMSMLSRQERESPSYKTMEFKLLYQLVNRVPYDLQEDHYLSVRNWMEAQLESERVS